jgi:hypothetical protein
VKDSSNRALLHALLIVGLVFLLFSLYVITVKNLTLFFTF